MKCRFCWEYQGVCRHGTSTVRALEFEPKGLGSSPGRFPEPLSIHEYNGLGEYFSTRDTNVPVDPQKKGGGVLDLREEGYYDQEPSRPNY